LNFVNKLLLVAAIKSAFFQKDHQKTQHENHRPRAQRYEDQFHSGRPLQNQHQSATTGHFTPAGIKAA
jgi:hypothetical protein